MKGMVFTAFLDMVESQFSADMVDDILDDANPASGGAYTAVGTYDHQELVDMVIALSKRTGIEANALVQAFGTRVFSVFARNYPHFFDGVPDALTFLSGIEDIIHAEVIKLYPDAQLPKFDCRREGHILIMDYRSPRHFADLAHGLILGCAQHFNETLAVERSELNADVTRFRVERQQA
jgi:hypothetical protein